MIESFSLPIFSAIWLGILTSISPCPLAANIAAISYVGKKVDQPRMVLLGGIMYTFGRMLSYLLLGVIIVGSLLSIPEVSRFLQNQMNIIMGPMLILIGLFLLEMISIKFSGMSPGESTQKQADKLGIWGAGFLGFIFALSFCPVSAGLFFGSLIPLAMTHQSQVILPTFYGIGTALPVIIFAFVIAFSTKLVGALFNKLTVFELWARRVTGVVFILVGIYYTLRYIFKLF